MPLTARKYRTQAHASAAQTRSAILQAAAEIFAREGLAGARTEAIAAGAGVNKAMLYYYFKSKHRLYEAVVEDHFLEFNRRAIELLSEPGSAREILMRYVELHMDFMSSRRRYASLYQQIMLAGGKPLAGLVRKHFAPRAQALDRVLERGMRDGEFRKADRTHTAVSITALIVFYFSASRVLLLLGHDDAYSEENLQLRKREVSEFIRHGLFTNPEVPRT
jgi:TetR/AcrR family transcriptional regulator